jgi:glucokinase
MFAGIDLGGTGIKGVLADKSGKIISTGRIPTPKTAKEIDLAIASLARTLATEANVPFTKIKAIGIGSAGTIDTKNGKIITSPNIPVWSNYPLARKIEKLTGKQTFLENDANIALMGEQWLGKGGAYSNWIMLTLGTGIGGCAVVDGKILRGRNGAAAEFGHITLDHNGNNCGCGSKGCFECYASATAIIRLAESLIAKYPSSSVAARIKTEKINAKMISDEYGRKDPLAIEVIETTSYFLGVGIASLANTFNPEAIIIGGGLSRSLGMFLPGIRRELELRAMKGIRENIKIFAVKHEDKGPALGAVKLAMDRLTAKKR